MDARFISYGLSVLDPVSDELCEEEKKVAKNRLVRCTAVAAKLSIPFDSVKVPTVEDFAKRKRKKQPPPTNGKQQAKPAVDVPRDANGNIVFPITLKCLSVLSLGQIVTKRKKYHGKHYIYPVGFKSTRWYPSMKEFSTKTLYVSEILDNGEEPIFRVTCEGTAPIEANTPSGAWAEVGKRVNDVKEKLTGKRMFTQLSGPEMFGLSHPSIVYLMQEMPGANELETYERIAFDVTPYNAQSKKTFW